MSRTASLRSLTQANPALLDMQIELPQARFQLAEIGQRVTFIRDAEKTPELTDEERKQTFTVKAVLGLGGDQVVRLVTGDGLTEFGWFRVTQLAPAAPAKSTPKDQQPIESEDTMQDLQTKAQRFEARVTQLSKSTKSWAHAFHLAQQEDEAGAIAYRLSGINATTTEEVSAPAPVLNLSVRSGETFDQVAQRYAVEKGVSLRQAIHDVGRARPDLASARD